MAPSLSNGAVNGDVRPCPFSLQGSNLTANGHVILTDVPDNITVSPSNYTTVDKSVGSFVGFNVPEAGSRHVVPIGQLKGIRFMSIFRFKVWWTTLWVGSNGRDLEQESQIVVLQKSDAGRPYVVLLPLLEGSFRASIQPGAEDFLDVCVESGSTKVNGNSFNSVLYLHAGADPFKLVKDAVKVTKAHLGTFNLLEDKTPPGIVDKFGWCTWDAFYLTVHPRGVIDGVRKLAEGGCPPGLVIVDDGWQSIGHDSDPITKEGMGQTVAGEQMPCRLLKFQENYKFRDYVSPKDPEGTKGKGMGAFVKDLKEEFKTVYHVYVWHASPGYWGGIRPNVPGLPDAKVIKPILSPGLQNTMKDLAVDKIVDTGVGLVPPESVDQMFEGLHSHLKSAGIDGVKVDVMQVVELLGEDYGGRVNLAKSYYDALTVSARKYFRGNGVIASMEHCNDFMFLGTKAICLGRVGDDFWPSGDQNGTFWLQGCHMVHCAYNSLWMGNFIQPDWDMFQSTHPCAAFHAASRAISGGPIYVSDTVGNHNFELLKALALPDGSILRCEYYALPTGDCLFEDPLHDGRTMLKIWNLNKFNGVLGAFNCQGGGWSRETRQNQSFAEFSRKVTSKASPMDIEWNSGKNPVSIEGVQLFALYYHQAKKLVLSKPTEDVELSLEPFNFELIIVSPVTVLPGKSVQFAPIGLVNMLNTGGAVQSLVYNEEGKSVEVGVKGAGEMTVFASEKPSSCRIGGNDVAFEYDENMVVVHVPWPGTSALSTVEYIF